MTKTISNSRKINYIDLFAGAGGFSEGFFAAGYTPIAHVEMNPHACDTLLTRACYHFLKKTTQLDKYYEYLSKKISREDLYSLLPNDIYDSVICETMSEANMNGIISRIDSLMMRKEIRNVDIVIGGPPCQAYSHAGRSRKCMDNDPRNELYKYYFQILEKYSPEMFVFENVPGILTAKGGSYLKKIQQGFRVLGYELEYKILNAADYGVIQHRKRLILVGWKKNHKHTFPILVPSDNTFLVGDILFDLPKIQAGENANAYANDDINSYLTTSNIRTERDILTWHVARNNLSRDREIYKKAIDKWDNEHQRLKYSDLPPELITHKNISGFLDRFKVVAADLPTSHTMMAHICKDGHYYIHPDKQQARSLTVREAARVQSFPDNYFFEGSRTAAFMQIGNAVPPLMAKVIALSIAEQFEGETIKR